LNRFLQEAKTKKKKKKKGTISVPTHKKKKSVRIEVTSDIQNVLLDSYGIATFFIAQ
jgi:hypothetical protein